MRSRSCREKKFNGDNKDFDARQIMILFLKCVSEVLGDF